MGNHHYIIEKEPIGDGGFAKVYKAKKNGTDQIFAIKIFHDPKGTMTEQDKKQVFDKEVKILQSCKHPNIIKYFEHSEIDYSIVTEFADGGDL